MVSLNFLLFHNPVSGSFNESWFNILLVFSNSSFCCPIFLLAFSKSLVRSSTSLSKFSLNPSSSSVKFFSFTKESENCFDKNNEFAYAKINCPKELRLPVLINDFINEGPPSLTHILRNIISLTLPNSKANAPNVIYQ